MSKRHVNTGMLVATLVLVHPPLAQADPPRGPLVPKDPTAVSCSHPATELSGQVTLDSSCIYEQSFTIKESNTTLDCNGAQLTSADSYLVTVSGEVENVTVKNCYVTGGKGVAVRAPKQQVGETDEELRQRSPRNVVFTNLHLKQSTNVGMYIHHHVVGATIKDSVIVDNSSAGVYLSPYGRQSVVQNNLIQGNGHLKPDGVPRVGWYRREGVAVDGSSLHVIEGNHFDNNAIGGVLLYKNCWEHAATNPDSTPRTEHAHSNIIRNNAFSNMPFGVWIASRQSMDLVEMECGDPTPYANPIILFNFFHPTYASHKSSYASMYLPWVSVWPDFAEKNVVEGNVFAQIELGAVRVEDDEARVTGNFFLGDFDYVFVGAPFRAKLDSHPVLDTVISDNSFSSPVAQVFGEHLALIPEEHEGTVLSNNYRACQTPWGTWLHHGASVVAYVSDATAPGGCSEEVRTCSDGALGGSYADEVCDPAPWVDGGVDAQDAGAAEDGGGAPVDAGANLLEEAGHDASGSSEGGNDGTPGAEPGGSHAPDATQPSTSSDGGCRVGHEAAGSWPMLMLLSLAASVRRRTGRTCFAKHRVPGLGPSPRRRRRCRTA